MGQFSDQRASPRINLTDEPGEIIVVHAPGGCRSLLYEELGPATRSGTPDPSRIAAILAKHHITLLGPPLAAG
jgi:hypothetical protein